MIPGMNRNTFCGILVFFAALIVSFSARAASYRVAVGETLTLDVPSVSIGYVDKAIWACANPAVEFVSKSTVSATVRVTASFEGYAVVELVYVEKYVDGRGFTRANTYTEDFYVSCSTGSSGGGQTAATSISVEPEIEVAIGKTAEIGYELYPEGSTADVFVSLYPGTYFNSVSVNTRENSIEGIARSAGIETVTVYFRDENGDKVSSDCKVTVFDPTWVAPESMSVKPVLLMAKGTRTRILPVLSPRKATTLYTWKSDNMSVAYDTGGGEIFAKDCGSANITVRTANGLTAKCNVIVVDELPDIPGFSSALDRAADMISVTETDVIR